MPNTRRRLATPVLASAALLGLLLTGCATGNPDVAGNDTPSAAATAESTNGNASTNIPDDEEGDRVANGEVAEWAEGVLDFDNADGMIAGAQGRLKAGQSHKESYTSQAAGTYTLSVACRDGGPVTFVATSGDTEIGRLVANCTEDVTKMEITSPAEGLVITVTTPDADADWGYAIREG